MGRERIKKLTEIYRIMFQIGLFTFGGGWSIIAQMQDEFVEKRGWMTKEQVVDFMSIAKSFPGIMIINMSVLCGYAMGGVSGAISAAFGLSSPALLAIAAITYCYAGLRENVLVARLLNGVRSVVIPIIISACLKLWATSMKSLASWGILILSVVLCLLTDINKLLLILAALAAGLWIWRGANGDDLS